MTFWSLFTYLLATNSIYVNNEKSLAMTFWLLFSDFVGRISRIIIYGRNKCETVNYLFHDISLFIYLVMSIAVRSSHFFFFIIVLFLFHHFFVNNWANHIHQRTENVIYWTLIWREIGRKLRHYFTAEIAHPQKKTSNSYQTSMQPFNPWPPSSEKNSFTCSNSIKTQTKIRFVSTPAPNVGRNHNLSSTRFKLCQRCKPQSLRNHRMQSDALYAHLRQHHR